MTSFQSPAGDGRPLPMEPPERWPNARMWLVLGLGCVLEISPLLLWMLLFWLLSRLA